MAHHVMQVEDTKDQCPYCKQHMGDGWYSEFLHHKHYKVALCQSCGTKNSLVVEFDGSGHDSWAGHERWRTQMRHAIHNQSKPPRETLGSRVRKELSSDSLELIDEEFRYVEEPIDELTQLMGQLP